jgi:hypothetical protein
MDNIAVNKNKITEYSFRWGKQFTFLTLKTSDTKLVVSSTDLKIDMTKFYLGFIKGKNTTLDIPINSISNIYGKTLISLTDLIIPAIYVFGGFFNPLFFLVVPLSIWACINSSIIIATKSNAIIKIPSFNRKDANEFIHYINDLFIEP